MSFSKTSSFPDYGATGTRLNRSRMQSNTNFDVNAYHQLCDFISCNIFSINNNVTALEKASKEVGTVVDTPLLRDKIHTTQQSTKELVTSTTHFLKELTAVVSKGGREHRLQAERVRNEFQATVQRYDISQKQLGPKLKHAVLQQSARSVWNDGDAEDATAETQSLLESERLQQQQYLQEELDLEQGLLVEREQKIQEIESNMLDVNQVFRELAAMVREQGDTIGTIEENITSVAYNVEEGQQQLAKASNYQKAYRKKLCCLILVLVVVAIALTIILYFSLHS